MSKKAFMLVIVAGLVLGGYFGGNWLVKGGRLQFLLPPDFQVASAHAARAAEGLELVYVYSAEVTNRGFTGEKTMVVELKDATGKTYKKEQTIKLERNETRSVSFRFPEASLMGEVMSAVRGDDSVDLLPRFQVSFVDQGGSAK